jgi:hypothetical protein
MSAATDRQQTAALRQREKIDGTAFVFGGNVRGIGILGVPTVEAQLALGGPMEKVSALLEVRRSWFPIPPVSGGMESLSIFTLSDLQLSTAILTGFVPPAAVAGKPARTYLVTSINVDDPLTYAFTLLDR